MEINEAKRLKELVRENTELKKMHLRKKGRAHLFVSHSFTVTDVLPERVPELG